MFRTSLFAVAAFAVSALPAFADQVVTYDRAALSDPAEVEALYAQIEAAAVKECRRDLRFRAVYDTPYGLRRCVRESIAAAVEQVGSPELAIYAEGAPEPRLFALAD